MMITMPLVELLPVTAGEFKEYFTTELQANVPEEVWEDKNLAWVMPRVPVMVDLTPSDSDTTAAQEGDMKPLGLVRFSREEDLDINGYSSYIQVEEVFWPTKQVRKGATSDELTPAQSEAFSQYKELEEALKCDRHLFPVKSETNGESYPILL
jgi:hypothetical protein